MTIERREGKATSKPQRSEAVDGVEWIDDQVVPGKAYTYTVSSVLGGESGAARLVEANARGRVTDFEVQAVGRKVELSWKLPPETNSVLVLRSSSPISDLIDDQGSLRPTNLAPIKTLVHESRYEDKDVVLGKRYYYALVARHPTGACSPSDCRSVGLAPPPPPPAAIEYSVAPGYIYVKWPSVTGLAEPIYRLVRTESANPHAPDANRKTWRLKSTTFEDKEVVAGRSYWYWVASENGTVVSSAAHTGPVLAVDEVMDLKATPSSQEVQLSWTVSHLSSVKRVEIHRQVADPGRAPTAGGEGALLVATEPDRFVDAGLCNGTTYVYRVRCVFAKLDGTELVTRGDVTKATPFEPPPVVDNIRGDCASNLTIRWENPHQAEMRVFRGRRAPSVKEGEILPLSGLGALGTILRSVFPESADDSCPDASEPFYSVVSVNQHSASYCGCVQFVEIERLDTTSRNDNIVVEWDWPPNCDEAILQISGPGEKDDSGEVERIRRSGPHEVVHCHTSAPGRFRVHVQCVVPQGKLTRVAGSGRTDEVSSDVAKRVDWHFRRSHMSWFWRNIPVLGRQQTPRLVIVPSGRLQGVRVMRLIGKVNDCPRSPTDGLCLAEWKDESGEVMGEIDLPVKDWPNAGGEVYCLLFVEPEDLVTVVHPTFEDMILYV